MAAGSSSASVPPVAPVSAAARLAPLAPQSREAAPLTPGQLLRLMPGGSPEQGWQLAALDSGQVLTLMQPPLDDLAPGDELLLRVLSTVPKLALELVERRDAASASDARRSALAGGGARDPSSGRGTVDSGWSQLSALRADVASWRRQVLTDAPRAGAALTVAQLVQGWTEALAQGRPPMGPGGEPFWLLPQPYWLRRERGEGGAAQGGPAATPQDTDDEPALSLLMKWRDAAIGIQLQGPRHALRMTLLAESEAVLTALRSELPRLVSALMRAGVRLQRLGWRQQALWVPVDPFPDLRGDPALLSAAAELLLILS